MFHYQLQELLDPTPSCHVNPESNGKNCPYENRKGFVFKADDAHIFKNISAQDLKETKIINYHSWNAGMLASSHFGATSM